MPQSLIPGILSNDTGSISRAITLIENDLLLSNSFFSDLHGNSSQSIRIGITGPPGAGKSTLTNELIETILSNNKTVGVIAVDPTSPFTGGALLGDRVRMNKYIWDNRVFIRSMGSHGDLGGLARKAQEAGDVLAASGKDIILFETVGVGQGEHDVAKAADLTIVILVPESGDEIQLMKAGLIEIGNIFAINKADHPGANKLMLTLKNFLSTLSIDEDNWLPQVVHTIATEGKGTDELVDSIESHRTFNEKQGIQQQNWDDRYRRKITEIITDDYVEKFWDDTNCSELQEELKKNHHDRTSPYILAKQMLER